ncbi:hypothetical protein Mal48_07980 [Thalassoglobus polymorphus]|uniref:DUF1570 domain-containing protein n=2 Tax=Thalassoglobus polymorphus TaxID=2527994 RepID=A0A517QIW6_9PLAN|nr:hypothetical protein Mal48_07980 [Thalassoglobus polymorphus]
MIKTLIIRSIGTLFVISGLATGATVRAESPHLALLKEQYKEAHANFAQEMLQLAEFCRENSFFSDADEIIKRASPSDEGLIDYDDLPTSVLPDLPKTLGQAETQWRVQLRKIEEDYSLQLYRLALQAIQKRHASFAYQLVRELVYHNPDHRQGRKLLGYARDGENWSTPFSKRMRTRGFIDHPRFGWIHKNNVDKYLQGQRLFDGRWMTAAKEAALRKDFRKGWEVETEHFHIKTNLSQEKAVEISRQLETFHQFFMREFAAFFQTSDQMKKLFGGGAVSRGRLQDRHRIYYYSNREEFVQELQNRNQSTQIATGFYLPQARLSFFYYDDDPEQAKPNQETMFHEVTHQILGESGRRLIDVGEHNNFWVIEGFACYLESFEIETVKTDSPEEQQGKIKISTGNPTHPRIYWAKRIVTADEFYIPMRQFMSLGKRQFQRPPENHTLHEYYSQATGLVHFFMHYQDGLYRDAFIEYLSQVYSPIDRVRYNPDSLETLTEVPFGTLDMQYLDYLKSLKTQR